MGQVRREKAAEPQMSLFPPMQLLPGRVQDDVDLVVGGVVERVLYSGSHRGRMELIVNLDDGITAKVFGRGDPLAPGDRMEAAGRWVPDPKYGRSFEADNITAHFPDTTDGIVRYLMTSAVRGVGAGTAGKLASFFGAELPNVMTRPTELLQAGISEDQAAAIASHFELRTKHKRLLSVLLSHKLTEKTAEKVIRRYGDRAPGIVANNPYQLADDIKGIGFRKADAIAISQGLSRDSSERIQAGLKAVAQSSGHDGDTCQARDRLILEAADLLLLSEREIRAQEEILLKSGSLILDRIGGREVVYSAKVHECETWIAQNLFDRLRTISVGENIDHTIEACADHVHQGQAHFKGLHEHQHLAVRMALENRVAVVTGGPGTGKTATLKTVIACLKAINEKLRFTVCAPTGAAAQRITESTGHPASTAHVALGARGDGFAFNKGNQLKTDVFIIDESSMIDIWMMRAILEALPMDARILFIGDANQLPSVGIGNVLCDLIDSGAIPVARLTKVYRQGAGSEIAFAAEAINAGGLPKILKPNKNIDNWTVLVDTPAQAVQKLLTFATHVIPNDLKDFGFDNIRDFQVITPGHQHEAGTINLNHLLQSALNPADNEKREYTYRKGLIFREGDKVVQLTNDGDRQIFNGNIGIIAGIDTSPRPRLYVEFRDREIVYDKGDLEALAQAWAITVHKSQGSEAPVVAPIMTTQHYILLKRNLYYTALTRARKLCCTIGQYRALRTAVMTEGSRRLTGLSQRLAALSYTAKRNTGVIAF